MPRRRAYAVVAAACALPRLAVVLHERGEIMARLTEKSDLIVETFVESGTFGFVPGEPTAYTQPLYGFFLTPLYLLFGRSWLAVGLAQTLVAVATALLVYELGRRLVSARAGLLAALVTTLHPYVVWHDVHVNREILDGLLAAAFALLTVLLAQRRSWPLAAALGVVSGLAILGNARLVLLPLVAVAYVAWRWPGWRPALAAAGVITLAAAITIAPWAIRNKVQLGCWALTTDSRALWKANNPATYDLLARGGWIDDVPELPGAPPSPELAAGLTESTGRLVRVDECAQMRLYREEVLDFWAERPGEKAKLAGQAVVMLWNPGERAGDSADVDTGLEGVGRRVIEPGYIGAVMALALGGALVAGRRLVVLAVALLGYQTLAAMVFAGTPRYRVPWDFLLALLAGAALTALWERRRR